MAWRVYINYLTMLFLSMLHILHISMPCGMSSPCQASDCSFSPAARLELFSWFDIVPLIFESYKNCSLNLVPLLATTTIF